MDDALKALRSVPKVRYAHFGSSRLTDVGLGYVAELESLERLGLEYTQVTNDGVSALREAKKLRSLYLKGLPIDDNALDEISHLMNLEEVGLNGTKATRNGVDRFSKALPNCKINWDPNYR